MICHPEKGDCLLCTFGSLKGCAIDTGVKLWAQDQGYGVSKYSGRPYKRREQGPRGVYAPTPAERSGKRRTRV